MHKVIPWDNNAGDQVAQHARHKDEGIAHTECGKQPHGGQRGLCGLWLLQQILWLEAVQEARQVVGRYVQHLGEIQKEFLIV